MKRFLLIFFFSSYYLFTPFVFINCGEDVPYDKAAAENKNKDGEEDKIDCDTIEFLTVDCVDEIDTDTSSGNDDDADEDDTETNCNDSEDNDGDGDKDCDDSDCSEDSACAGDDDDDDDEAAEEEA